MRLLFALAGRAKIIERRDAMFAGAHINSTEIGRSCTWRCGWLPVATSRSMAPTWSHRCRLSWIRWASCLTTSGMGAGPATPAGGSATW